MKATLMVVIMMATVLASGAATAGPQAPNFVEKEMPRGAFLAMQEMALAMAEAKSAPDVAASGNALAKTEAPGAPSSDGEKLTLASNP